MPVGRQRDRHDQGNDSLRDRGSGRGWRSGQGGDDYQPGDVAGGGVMFILPAPLMSRASRPPESPFEGWGRSARKNFLHGRNRKKVGMQCTVFWWIRGLADAKSLIVDSYSLTKYPAQSTKCPYSSTKCRFSSTGRFAVFAHSFSFFPLIIKEKEKKEASTKENESSTKVNRCLFFNPPKLSRFSRNWWIVVDFKCFVFNDLRADPPISTNPPVFSLYPPFWSGS